MLVLKQNKDTKMNG